MMSDLVTTFLSAVIYLNIQDACHIHVTSGWPILCGPWARLAKSRRAQKLLLLFADSTLLYLHR